MLGMFFVSWIFPYDGVYRFAYAVEMGVDVVIAEAHHPQAKALQIGRSFRVFGLFFRFVVLGTVDFHHQLALGAVEVDDVLPKLLLAAEADGAKTAEPAGPPDERADGTNGRTSSPNPFTGHGKQRRSWASRN